MRILFINHTAEWSGAETSLMRLLEALGQRHELIVACPERGRLHDELRRRGVWWTAIPATAASLRPHPIRTPLGIAQLAQAGVAVSRIVRRVGPDVIHANGLRAGLISSIPARLNAPPVLVQIHDVLPRSALSNGVRRTIAATASAVSAVSEKAAARFNEGLSRPVAFRTHISIDHRRFDPEAVTPSTLRTELGIGDAPLLAQIAQITPWKGQDFAIQVLTRLRNLEADTHLAVVGGVSFASARYDNVGYERELHRLVERLDVSTSVHFLGPRDDVPGLMTTSDLTLLPSVEEPFGTSALESMAMGTPPVVSADGGMSEFVEDGISGRVIPRDRPDEWAAAVLELLRDRAALDRMGAAAIRVAARFTDARYAEEMEAIYARLTDDRRGARPGQPTSRDDGAAGL